MDEARMWIERLGLQPHPEGGFFRESYRAAEIIPPAGLPSRFPGPRPFSTAIYFLLRGGEFSALHRIRQDEVWHFYEGTCLTVHVLDEGGAYTALKLGRLIEQGQSPQAVVRAGCRFGASVDDAVSFALVGCTVAPGFDFADLELCSQAELLAQYPQHRQLIRRLTRPPGA